MRRAGISKSTRVSFHEFVDFDGENVTGKRAGGRKKERERAKKKKKKKEIAIRGRKRVRRTGGNMMGYTRGPTWSRAR